MTKVKKNDFIEIDFVAKIKGTNQIFDLTEEKTAKENNMYDDKFTYEPQIICVGKCDVISGLDDFLEGKEVGKSFEVEIEPEKAFGKKNVKLIKLVPLSEFKKRKIIPYPGLKIEFDGYSGVIRTVSGGRILVDFNHPLASKELVYKVKINKIIEDEEDKINGLLKILVGQKDSGLQVETGNVILTLKIPPELQTMLVEEIKKRIPSIKKVEFK